jgi:hypothetical protein
MEDLVGWFQHAKAEYLLARIPADSYFCYMHMVRALPSEALTPVRNLIRASRPPRRIRTNTKDALLARFTPPPLQMFFSLLDMPPLGNPRSSALFSEIQALVQRLQSHFILIMSHWSSGLPVCFPSHGTQVQIPWGYLCETGILLLASSRQ